MHPGALKALVREPGKRYSRARGIGRLLHTQGEPEQTLSGHSTQHSQNWLQEKKHTLFSIGVAFLEVLLVRLIKKRITHSAPRQVGLPGLKLSSSSLAFLQDLTFSTDLRETALGGLELKPETQGDNTAQPPSMALVVISTPKSLIRLKQPHRKTQCQLQQGYMDRRRRRGRS